MILDDFSKKTLRSRREWHDIFKMQKEKNLQPRILSPARLSFRIEERFKKTTFQTRKSSVPQ